MINSDLTLQPILLEENGCQKIAWEDEEEDNDAETLAKRRVLQAKLDEMADKFEKTLAADARLQMERACGPKRGQSTTGIPLAYKVRQRV